MSLLHTNSQPPSRSCARSRSWSLLRNMRRNSPFAIPTRRRPVPRRSSGECGRARTHAAAARRPWYAAPPGSRAALRRLADAGLVTLATYTEAMRCIFSIGSTGWCTRRPSGAVLAIEARNARALSVAVSAAGDLRAREHVVRETGRVLLAAGAPPTMKSSRKATGCARRPADRGTVGQQVLEPDAGDVAGSRSTDRDRGRCPVGAYYREVTRQTRRPQLSIATRTCNAVGGSPPRGLRTPSDLGQWPPHSKYFEFTTRRATRLIRIPRARARPCAAPRALALGGARAPGAVPNPHVDTSVTERLAHVGAGADYLAEAVALPPGTRSRATRVSCDVEGERRCAPILAG